MLLQKDQEYKMRWILFYVFVGIFIIIVFGTLAVIFLGFGRLTVSERGILFNVFLVEIGLAVVALFYTIFGLRRKGESIDRRVRLDLGELKDVRKLVGKSALLTLKKIDGTILKKDVPVNILDDNGPYLPIDLPENTCSVYISIDLPPNKYTGSFLVGNYLVDLSKG